MTDYAVSEVEHTLNRMFPPQWLRDTAKTTGLIKRDRIVDPVLMFWVLTLGFGVRLQRTLASLKRNYERTGKIRLSDSSWYERFTPELVAFLKACVTHGIEHLAQESNNKLSQKLKQFQDLLIQDSTIIRLHEKLHKKWPAARCRKIAAGVKVSLLVSAVSNGPKSVALFGERVSEVKTLRIGPWVKDRIILLDLGFYKHQVFQRIKENGGFFVSRLKANANPTIVGVNTGSTTQSPDWAGKQIRDVLSVLPKDSVLDVMIRLDFRRRKYNGSKRKDSDVFRLVAVFNQETGEYHAYVTNISHETLDAKDIAALYSARWDIELINKELKSKYALDVVKTTNPQIIEAYIWIAILTLLVSRRIYNLIRASAPEKKMVRYTKQRWSTIFSENASDQLTVILKSNNIQKNYETVSLVYTSQALDPHVKRPHLMDPWTT